MPYACPHCSESIPEAVSKDTMKQRLAEKQQQIEDFKAEAREQRQRADGLEATSAEWRAAAEELAAVKARQAEDTAFSEAGLRADLSDRHRRILRGEYNTATSGQGDEAPSFAEWLSAELGAEQVDPLFAGLVAGDGGTPPASPAGAPKARPRPPVDRSIGAPPPPPVSSSDPAQIAARYSAWVRDHATEHAAGDYSQMPADLRQMVPMS